MGVNTGDGMGAWAGTEALARTGEWARTGDSLGPGGLWCRSIMFWSISPVCFTLLVSTGGTGALMGPVWEAGSLGMKAGLRLEGDSGFGNLPSPGTNGSLGNSLWGEVKSVSVMAAFPNRGRGDFGESLSRLLVSWLLKRALSALTSKPSFWNHTQHKVELELKTTVIQTKVDQDRAKTKTSAGYDGRDPREQLQNPAQINQVWSRSVLILNPEASMPRVRTTKKPSQVSPRWVNDL